jgi:RNA polymerase sigma factor (sigma-70 family)
MLSKRHERGEEVSGGMTVTDGTDSSLTGSPQDRMLEEYSDVELLRLVRAGRDDAFGELFVRHGAAARGFAMRSCAEVADAEDMAAEAFFRVFQAVRRGSGPQDNVRAYLLTVLRRLAMEWRMRRRDVPIADDELGRQLDAGYLPSTNSADIQLIVRAFTTLPGRWRAVLWRVEVEGERPATAARHFGLSPNATAALARRARQGLRAAYLQAHLAPSGGPHGCRPVVAKLGGFTAGQVTGAEAARIREHLSMCVSCQALHAELEDVCRGLRRYAGSMVAPAAGAALGWHGVLAKVAGQAAAFGSRMKLAVAALSVTAVSGAGFAAVPVVSHLAPSPLENHGVAFAPLLDPVTSHTPMPSSTMPPASTTATDPMSSRHPESSHKPPHTTRPHVGKPIDSTSSSQVKTAAPDHPSGNGPVTSGSQAQHVPPGQLKAHGSDDRATPTSQTKQLSDQNSQGSNQQ